jgi:hypothetical protein
MTVILEKFWTFLPLQGLKKAFNFVSNATLILSYPGIYALLYLNINLESVIELGNAVEAKYAIGAARSEISANFFCLAT